MDSRSFVSWRGLIRMSNNTSIEYTFVAMAIIFFILFIGFVYIAIWLQSLIFGEMAIASIAFSILFAWFLDITTRK